ncbi:MAG: hypothetical protein GVY02_03435 [Bacteroidetes bacterium]|jgi:hypothetical protein|nr:hypothetical protein [Bacteroidota bacterium]
MFRAITSCFLSLLILSISMPDTFMMLSFKLNHKHIAEHHCMNRDNPDSDCNGTCYLKKSLEKAHEHQEENPIPMISNEKPAIAFLLPMPVRSELRGGDSTERLALRQHSLYQLIWASRLLRPPMV